MVLALIAGLGMLALSYAPVRDAGQWTTDFLLGVGTTVLLFVPLYFVGRRVDRHIEDVRVEARTAVGEVRDEAASHVDELAEQVSSMHEEVERRLDDLSMSVSERLERARQDDEDIFTRLKTYPTRDTLVSAMRRAAELRVVSEVHPPRVKVSSSNTLYLDVHYSTVRAPEVGHEDLVEFGLTDISGKKLEQISWPTEQSVEDCAVELGRRLTAYSDQQFDLAEYLTGLSDLLLVGLSESTLRPIIELCPPQWAVLDGAISTYGDVQRVDATALEFEQNQQLIKHFHSKRWIHSNSFDRAHWVLRSLFSSATSFGRHDSVMGHVPPISDQG